MADHDPLHIFDDLTRRQADQIETPATLRAAIRSDFPTRRRPTSRRRLMALVAAGVLTIGAGVGVAALLRSGQPSRPEGGPACRSEPRLDSEITIALSPGDDPLTACGALWEQGQLPNPDVPLPAPQPIPPLVVCVGQGGAYEVYPGPADLCAALGLIPGEPADEETNNVTDLTTRIAEDINGADCAPASTVEPQIRALLDELGLDTWTIITTPGADTAECVKAEVVSSDLEIRLGAF